MASQQILFAETIAGMKKALKRTAYESDSDSDIDKYGNRGHKLKRRARFSHKGQLVPSGGPSLCNEYVDYDGVRRAILQRNPPLIDEEGYEIDSEDDDDRVQDAEAAAAEMNPYSNIRIERKQPKEHLPVMILTRVDILAPLTSATDLPTHPTLSKPFTSTKLDELVKDSRDRMQKENHTLWKVRHLLTALCGDYTWVPCEMMVKPSDIELYSDDHVARHLLSLSKTPAIGFVGAQSSATVNGNRLPPDTSGNDEAPGDPHPSGNVTEEGDISMTDIEATDKAERRQEQKAKNQAHQNGAADAPKSDNHTMAEDKAAHDTHPTNKSNDKPQINIGDDEMADMADSASHPENIVVSAQGLKQGSRPNRIQTPLGLGDEQPFVHPMFLPPSGAKPDRDIGLPEQEAEDMRRLLALYVQKQEEVCRGAKRLYQGFLLADKLRKDVLHWSKAEAHSGPNHDMSDGEDWYDREEWGLEEDLKKGQDEEEEDTVTTGKKTRNRK